MKKSPILLLLLITFIGFSQKNPITFEKKGNGTYWKWDVFESGTPKLEFVKNPKLRRNTSKKVAKFTVKKGAADYAGVITKGLGTFDLSDANSTVRIWVYKSVISDVGIKFEKGTASTGEIKVPNTKINQWEEIVFDMSPKIGEAYSTGITSLVIFPDFATRTQDNVIYFDNITFSPKFTLPSVSLPLVAAPRPRRKEADVLSIYSDAYTTNKVTNFKMNAFQGSGVINEADIQLNGNKAIKIDGLSYYGAQWNAVNVSSSTKYKYINLDYYSVSSTAFNFYLIDGTASIPGGNPSEPKYKVTRFGGDEALVRGKWKTISIPLSHFLNYNTGNFSYDLNDIIQWKLDGNGTLYIDNIYFSADKSSRQLVDKKTFNTSFYPASNTLNVYADNSIKNVSIYNSLGKQVMSLDINKNSEFIDVSKLPIGIYLIRYQLSSKKGSVIFIKE